jgi:hypothetical protein
MVRQGALVVQLLASLPVVATKLWLFCAGASNVQASATTAHASKRAIKQWFCMIPTPP